MIRRLLNVMTALSLLLCVAVVVLWVRSYWGSDYVSRGRTVRAAPGQVVSTRHEVRWTRGRIRLLSATITTYPPAHWAPPEGLIKRAFWGYGRLGPRHVGWEDQPRRSFWIRLGFHEVDEGMWTSWSDERALGVAVPAWLPVAAFALMPLLWLGRRWRLRAVVCAGRCAGCGYDLRATPGRCPECGLAGSVPSGR